MFQVNSTGPIEIGKHTRAALLVIRNVLWLLALIQTSGQNVRTSSPTAKVSFVILDERGHSRSIFVSSFVGANGVDTIRQFQPSGLEATKVPYGIYSYSLAPGSSNSPWLRGRVSVDRPECFFVITLSDDQISGRSSDIASSPNFVILGRIANIPKATGEQTWIRLQPLFSSVGHSPTDILVDLDGRFRIHRAMAGLYVLTVLRGAQPLHVQLASFDSPFVSTSFIVTLPESPPQVQRVLSK